jgi:hypothetical protein
MNERLFMARTKKQGYVKWFFLALAISFFLAALVMLFVMK